MSGHVDTFARDNLPDLSLWPVMKDSGYPQKLNCAAELLDRAVENGIGAKTVIHSPRGDMTYAALLSAANKVARVLTENLGLVSGNRVLIHGANTPGFAACWFGVQKAGGICVATMPLLRSRELGYIIEKANVRHVLVDASLAAEAKDAVGRFPGARLCVFNSDAAGSLDLLMRGKQEDFSNCETAADDVSLIAFTSGTTGQAKATVHFHRDVMAVCDSFPRHVLDTKADEVFAGTPPLGFTFGLGGLLLFPMRAGASTVLLEKTSPAELLTAIEQYGVTTLFTSPTGYRSLMDSLEKFNVRSLRKCISAGENLAEATFRQWRDKTGIEIIDGIGSTEMLHIFISSSGKSIRPGATGLVVRGYEACIMDETGRALPANQVGYLAVRGPTGCRYLSDPERQKRYVRFGWNFTGDAYRQDDDGYFWFHSRADDMIISSGYNISANEVENVILSHPEVKECGVVGKPDSQRGQIVKAFVVLAGGVPPTGEKAKAIQEFVKSEIAPYKYPREVEFVTELPRTVTGKLQRFRLRED